MSKSLLVLIMLTSYNAKATIHTSDCMLMNGLIHQSNPYYSVFLQQTTVDIRNIIIVLEFILLLLFIYLFKNQEQKQKRAIQQRKESYHCKLKIEHQNACISQSRLECKQRELIAQAAMLQNRNDQIIAFQHDLEYRIRLIEDPTMQKVFNPLLSSLNGMLNNNNFWKEFEASFVEVFPGFLKILSQKHPTLTTNDLKFCAYLKMNLNTKEIAILTGLSIRSVESRRYRLRQKLAIPHHNQLINFLHSI